MQIWNECEVVNYFGDNLGPGLRRLLLENSFSVASNNEFYVNFCGDEPVKINQWLCTLENQEAFFTCLPVLHEKEGLFFSEDSKLTEEAEKGWYFLDNPGTGKRSKNRLERLCSYHKPQLLYAIAQVFSREDDEKILFINNGHNPLPMKIWVNGRLIFSCYRENLIRRSECIIRLKAGSNLILVEREIIPQHKIKDMFIDTNFTFTLYPVSYLLEAEKGCSFLKRNMFDNINVMVDIITPKKKFEMGENIPFYLLPHNNGSKQKYEIEVIDINGNKIYSDSTEVLLQSDIILKDGVHGALKINIKKGGCISADEYVFVGDFSKDKGFADIDIMRKMRLLNIFDFQKNVVRNSIYPIDNNVYHYVFENLYYLLHVCDSKQYFYLDFIETHDQGRERNFGVLLPENYDKGKRYPLVLQYTAGYGDYAIPGLNGGYPEACIRTNRYRDAIVVYVACDYEYINDYEVMAMGDIYNYLMETYSVDRQRVSIVGFCGSTNSCMRLLLSYQGIFSAALFLAPYIDEETLEMMEVPASEAVSPYLVLNPSNGLFLPGATYAKHYQSEVTVAPGMEHEELFALYNNEYIIPFLGGCVNKKAALQIDLTEQIKHMGIAGMYTGKCIVFCDVIDENEKKVIREFLILMQLTKYRDLEIHIGEGLKAPENENVFYVLKKESLPRETAQEIWDNYGIQFFESGIFYDGNQYESPFFTVVLSKDRKRCFAIYDNSEALEKLKELWRNFRESSMFYRNIILWNKGKGFIGEVDKK